MHRHGITLSCFLYCCLLLPALPLQATPKIAVAANFFVPMQQLVADYAALGGERPQLLSGSTGKLYTQIIHGLPVDAFFAADSERPAKLETQGRTMGRFTYALGRLVLASSQARLVDGNDNVLSTGGFEHLALANPRLAPYGFAAKQTLEALGLLRKLKERLVYGENIAQTWQYVISGNAELGLVALSQWLQWRERSSGSHWLIPAHLHQPIAQQAVILHRGVEIQAFMAFIQSPAGRERIAALGYDLPEKQF